MPPVAQIDPERISDAHPRGAAQAGAAQWLRRHREQEEFRARCRWTRHAEVVDMERLGKAVRDTETAGSALVMYVGLLTGEEVLAEAESQARPRRRSAGRCGEANLSQLLPR